MLENIDDRTYLEPPYYEVDAIFKCDYCQEGIYEGDVLSKIKEKAIAYYLEGCGFRRIERLLGMSHNSVINWVKQAAKAVQKVSENYQQKEKVDVLELDELCTIVKKNKTKSGYGSL